MAAPVINIQPSNQSVIYHGTLNLSVDASNALHYAWLRGATSVGTDSSIYQRGNFDSTDRGIYKVRVSNADGTTTSGDATVIMQTQILVQPTSQAFIVGDLAASLAVGPMGYNITYTWYKDGTAVAAPNGVNDPIDLSPYADSSRGVYKVVVHGDNDATSTDATVTTQPNVTVQPVSARYTVGADATLTVTATGHSPTYQWKKDNTNLSGKTAASLALTPYADSSAGLYKVAVTSDSLTVTSDDATVASQAAITSTPNKTATQGVDYTYNPTATGMVSTPTWTLNGAPTGMTFNAQTGAIHWTPHYDTTNTGALELVVYGDTSATQDWTAAVSMVTPTISSTPTKTASEGVAYTYNPTGTVVDKDTWTLTGAPADMVFTPSTGAIRWIPLDRTNSGTLSLTLKDLNGLSSSSQDWTVAVTFTTPVITSSPDTTAYQNTPYSYQPITNDAIVTDRWTLTGTKPSNLLFDPTGGSISWTPTYDQTAVGPLTLTVLDPSDKTAVQTFSIVVAAAPAERSVSSGDRTYIGPYGSYVENLVWDIDPVNGCLIRVRK